MAGGLVGLLDDVAALAKLAAASVDDVGAAAGAASVKAAGVVVDDTAVTPSYVRGLAAERELPIVKSIAFGSLRNKLLFILPVALLLSEVAATLVEVILMVGGTYLCYEGAHKLLEALGKGSTTTCRRWLRARRPRRPSSPAPSGRTSSSRRRSWSSP
jgi:predicted DNA repair protein MutK